MANVTPTPSGGTVPPVSVIPHPSSDVLHNGFLLLLGQIIGVLIAVFIADADERAGLILVVLFAGLWLLFIINRTSVVTDWGRKVGL